MRTQRAGNRVIKSSGVGVGRSTQVAKRNPGTSCALGGARPAVVTYDDSNPSRQRPIGTRVKNGLQDGTAVGRENADIHVRGPRPKRLRNATCGSQRDFNASMSRSGICTRDLALQTPG
jgi:hypothetical protein